MRPKTPIEEARERRRAHPDWPRMYWVSFHRGDGHRFNSGPTTVTLDLTNGQPAEETAFTLTALLRALIAGENLHKPGDIRGCYLELRQRASADEAWPGTGTPDMVWRVTWDPERER